MSAWVSPPQLKASNIVDVAPSIAQAASTAFPPLWNIIAPAVAARGFPVIAIQWRPWSTGFCVGPAEAEPSVNDSAARIDNRCFMRPPETVIVAPR
jgi:hypothetical protein